VVDIAMVQLRETKSFLSRCSAAFSGLYLMDRPGQIGDEMETDGCEISGQGRVEIASRIAVVVQGVFCWTVFAAFRFSSFADGLPSKHKWIPLRL
jgi:hypothetical protein